jgi:hypothetical protein
MPQPGAPIEPPSYRAVLLARVATMLLVGLTIAGVAIFGVSSEVQLRLWEHIYARPFGPMSFRFVLQPVMAALAAWKDGSTDARLQRPPYLASIIRGDGARWPLLWEGIVATARIILLGIAMDAVYQVTVLKTFHPAEAAVVALLLAFVPYLLLRGPFRRILKRRLRQTPTR